MNYTSFFCLFLWFFFFWSGEKMKCRCFNNLFHFDNAFQRICQQKKTAFSWASERWKYWLMKRNITIWCLIKHIAQVENMTAYLMLTAEIHSHTYTHMPSFITIKSILTLFQNIRLKGRKVKCAAILFMMPVYATVLIN